MRLILVLLLFVSVTSLAFSIGEGDGFDASRREVLLRRLGHEILLQSGDRTSRVMPVKKIGENEYQVSFEKELTFQPDSLVNASRRLLADDPQARDYVINVVNCDGSSVAYGYAISRSKKDDIIACLGRVQPKACYRINVKFQPKESNTARNGYLLGGLSLLAVAGYMIWKPRKKPTVVPKTAVPETIAPQTATTNTIQLGSVLFDAERRELTAGGTTLDLTATETRVLRILALSPNEIIERSRLQKEIWEDEGVIVGRSLDVFISKLRKKLELDPALKIVVVRGKGYKLEVGN